MPCKSRIDAPGALQHVIARGINRQRIFRDDPDKRNFLDRLSALLKDSGIKCYAWAVLENHFLLLLRSGAVPISTLMRRPLTGYAVCYNLRHERSGHLFQNRYKSINRLKIKNDKSANNDNFACRANPVCCLRRLA
jgi:putative transposase